MVWKWVRGATTTNAEFADPTMTASQALCVYDESAGFSELLFKSEAPAGGVCGKRACWKDLGGKGYKYTDKDRTPDGLLKILLKPGDDGKAKIVIKGKGERVPLPSLPLALPIRVQLQSGNGECWKAAYPAIGAVVNDAVQFKGKAGLVTTTSTSTSTTTSTSSSTTTSTLPFCTTPGNPCGSCGFGQCSPTTEAQLVCVDLSFPSGACASTADCPVGEICTDPFLIGLLLCVPPCF